jgi:DNA-binding protein HU-alpha
MVIGKGKRSGGDDRTDSGDRVISLAGAAAAALVRETWDEVEAEIAPPRKARGGSGQKTDPSSAGSDAAAGPELKKKDLIERVITRSGLKRREVKPAVEAVLEELAAAIQAGEELNLPPLGKLKVTRAKELSNARVFHCRLRQAHITAPDGSDPLAEDDEEG